MAENHNSVNRQQLINTTAIADTWKDILHGNRKWFTKMSQKFAPVGKNIHRWGFWTNSPCPCCHQHHEDKEHLFNCTYQKCGDIQSETTMFVALGVYLHGRERYPWYGPDP
jgi:hypothetical protein